MYTMYSQLVCLNKYFFHFFCHSGSEYCVQFLSILVNLLLADYWAFLDSHRQELITQTNLNNNKIIMVSFVALFPLQENATFVCWDILAEL